MTLHDIVTILDKQFLMSVGTQGKKYPDNSIVCFAHDEFCNLYFGSYSDTLKCRNIELNPNVAISCGTLQIHGIARIVPYGTKEYWEGRDIYDLRFPKYKEIFELENNELYRIEPFVIWNYDSSKGEMYRDVLIFNKEYYESMNVYAHHSYHKR